MSSTKLLDLPLEIFELIVDKYLEDVLIKQVWHDREACSKPHLPITHLSLTLTSPTGTLKNVLSAKVLKLPGSAFCFGISTSITGLINHGTMLLSRSGEPRFRVLWCSNIIILQYLLHPGVDTALTHMLVKANWEEFVYRMIGPRKFRGKAQPLQSVAFLFRLMKETNGSWEVYTPRDCEAAHEQEPKVFRTTEKIVRKNADNSGVQRSQRAALR
jgi:hypothetical protein